MGHARRLDRLFAGTARTDEIGICRAWIGRGAGYTQVVTTHAIPTRRGRFITIEGPEGSGKSTMAARLRDDLVAGDAQTLLTREPGGTAIGEGIRALLLAHDDGPVSTEIADAFLFNAARAQLVAEVIRPALEHGETVICARFADSTIAYQGYGAGLPIAELRALEEFATGGLRPDLTILLDLPVEVGLARKSADEINRFEAVLDLSFHNRVRNGFLSLAIQEPGRFVVVDATVPADTVHDVVLGAVARHFPELGIALRARPTGPADSAASEPAHDAVRSTR